MGERRSWTRVVLIVAAGLLLVAALLPQTPLSKSAARYAGGVATASAGTYVTLRTLNAFLSTAQEIEVGGAFVVSGTAQPLKVLEPIDDTVERIASVVFALMVVSGVLSVAMGPVSAVGLAMMAGALVLWAAGCWGAGWRPMARSSDSRCRCRSCCRAVWPSI